jgi:hypothetical protein
MRCQSCQSEVVAGSRFCPSCGRPADVAVTAVTMAGSGGVAGHGAPAPARAISERFAPGELLAGGRYRIVGLLGRGGMGEVYRADDLRLGQAVALKFLPERWASDPAALARLLDEVRVARQVSHPNVCRVYDVVEVPGAGSTTVTFLSMEFIDGEDLASLLRRIGRLPEAKAVQIARELCAGLGAAHERGVLHRDLKPANIMIDGRGHARIMDFGLAGLAEELKAGGGPSAGTPAYMAPEHLTHGEVSVRSDLYALGLVLFEIFAGEPVFAGASVAELRAQHERGVSVPLSRLAPEVSLLVERVVMRCLEPDPRDRPPSAAMVAAALPGGDPLAAAIAAGETPSPELIAAAGSIAGVRPVWTLLAAFEALVLLVLVAVLNKASIVYQVPMAKSPDVLAERAQLLIAQMGYGGEPLEAAWGFEINQQMLAHAIEEGLGGEVGAAIEAARPAGVLYWYRQSPRYFEPDTGVPRIEFDRPRAIEPGMVGVRLDTLGRLVEFRGVPTLGEAVEATATPAPAWDWRSAFDAAGLDIDAFAPAEPILFPRVAFDARQAWTKAAEEGHALSEMRVEAASRLGRPVMFIVGGPWLKADVAPKPEELRQEARMTRALMLVIVLPFLIVPIAFAVYLARRNVRAGRGDARGAWLVAVALFATQLVYWLLISDHATPVLEYERVYTALASALIESMLVWVVYMAIEPYVRRRWPRTLVSWSRLLAGRVGDPLVGRDVVVGVLMGAAVMIAVQASAPIAAWRGAQKLPPPPTDLGQLRLASAAGQVADGLLSGAGYPMLALTLMLMLGSAVRWRWAARVAFGVLTVLLSAVFAMIIPDLTGSYDTGEFVAEHVVVGVMVVAGTYLVLWRFGLLAAAAGWFTVTVLAYSPVSLDFSTWFAPSAAMPLVVTGGLVAFGAWVTLRGRELVREESLMGTVRPSVRGRSG